MYHSLQKKPKTKAGKQQSEVNSEGLQEVEKEAKNKTKKLASKRSHDDSLEEAKESDEGKKAKKELKKKSSKAPMTEAERKKAWRAKKKETTKYPCGFCKEVLCDKERLVSLLMSQFLICLNAAFHFIFSKTTSKTSTRLTMILCMGNADIKIIHSTYTK